MIEQLPGLAFTILTALLGSFGVNVPESISKLVAGLTPAVQKLIEDLRNRGSASQETVTVLQDLLPVLAAVKADTSVDPRFTEWAELITEMITNVAIADADAQTLIDPDKLHEQ